MIGFMAHEKNIDVADATADGKIHSLLFFWFRLSSINSVDIIEFFYNSSISAKFWQNATRLDREDQNKKLPVIGIEPKTPRSSF